MKKLPFLVAALLVLNAAPALAHPGHIGHGDTGGFAGFMHPLTGIDHILAMMAVGLWAAFLGSRALWMVPTSFVLAMVGGFLLGMNDLILPAIEPGIAASVIVLGVMIAAAVRLPLGPSIALVGLFGFFHGQAHGGEMTGPALTFGLGFTAATILLHGAGLGLGLALARQRTMARGLGVLIAGVGVLVLGGMA